MEERALEVACIYRVRVKEPECSGRSRVVLDLPGGAMQRVVDDAESGVVGAAFFVPRSAGDRAALA